MSWQKLKNLIHSIKPNEFEELTAILLKLFLKTPFVVARSGDQPSGDARNLLGDISMQAKRYTGKRSPDAKTVEGDIRQVIRQLPELQVYVLALSRDTAQLCDTLDAVSVDTGLDIVTLELTDKLSDIGALCVTFWKDIHEFFDSSDICRNQEFLTWVEKVKSDLKTQQKIEGLRSRLKEGIQTQNHIQKDADKYLGKRFGDDSNHDLRFSYPIDLSKAIKRDSLESKIADWWDNSSQSICYLEGEEGTGKSWFAAKGVDSITHTDKNIVTFWLDSKDWKDCRSLFDLLRTCFSLIYPSYEEPKIAKLQNKAAKLWGKTLIVLDGVNEQNSIETAKQILGEYFKHKDKWTEKIRFVLTTRPLDAYPNFEHNLWNGCYKIPIGPFSDPELQAALTQSGLQPNDLPNALKDIAKIPRYFQTCIRLRELFHSFESVTKEMVLWADLLEKIKHTDPQVRGKFDWQSVEDAQEILAKLAQEANWTDVSDVPQIPVELLKKDFPDYLEVRRDLEEQRIALRAGKIHAKLSPSHIVLGWALYLVSLLDCTEFTEIKDFAEGFQNALEPIPSEDLRTEALFVALQLSAISPNTDLSQEQLSQKRAALMLAWFHSHNAQITDERLLFWAEEDPDAYAQVVEFEFERNNSPNYEDALIVPLAKAWLNKKGDLNRLASRLKKWLLPTHSVNSLENRKHTDFEGHRFPVMQYDPQVQLSAAALSILSQRPECEFLETLARCYEILERYGSPDENMRKLMRWGYTEAVLGDLRSLLKQHPSDAQLLKGVYGLADCLRVDLPSDLERPLTDEDKKWRIEQWNRRSKLPIDRIRDGEKLLTGDSPETNANCWYHGLDYLAVRKDLPGLCDKDQDELKRILYHISTSAELKLNEGLIPWIAKYEFEGYAKFACDFKINALDPKYPSYVFRTTEGIIFQEDDCERITEAIFDMKEHLTQGEDFRSDVEWLTSLLTEVLLFSAPKDKLTDWFEFLASHELLRISIDYKPLADLLNELLPKSVVKLAQQKLEDLRSSVSDNQPLSNDERQEFSEEDFWCTLYTYGTPINEETVKYALEELKMREPDSTGTFPMLRLALSDSKQFLDEMLVNEKIKEHLSSKNGRQFRVLPYDEGKNVPSYDTLMSSLPIEAVGSFLCSPDRRGDLARWGKELIRWLCSVLQGNEGDFDYNSEVRFLVDTKVLRTWAEQNTTEFSQLADEYLTELSKSPRYNQVLSHFTDAIRCLLLRFQPDKAIEYYRRWKTESFKTVISTQYGIETFLDQLWRVEDCKLLKHRDFRRKLLEECLNDEEIMFMALAALAGKGEEELWNLVIEAYLASSYAKERNLGVSILPWFGNDRAVKELERLKSEDPSQWVREHAWWAYEVAQQERSCREVYREALQTRDLFRISAVFEQIKPALSPTARWWRKIEHEEFREESQDIDSRLAALVDRFWYRWDNSSQTKSNIEIFGKKLKEYCRGEKLPAVSRPRLAPWWKPSSD